MVMCIGERTCFSAAFRADSALVDGQTAQQVGGMVIVLDVREPLSPQAAAGADAGAHRRLPNPRVPAFPACQFNDTLTAPHPETRGATRSEPERAGRSPSPLPSGRPGVAPGLTRHVCAYVDAR